jgi:hypothetical protein
LERGGERLGAILFRQGPLLGALDKGKGLLLTYRRKETFRQKRKDTFLWAFLGNERLFPFFFGTKTSLKGENRGVRPFKAFLGFLGN